MPALPFKLLSPHLMYSTLIHHLQQTENAAIICLYQSISCEFYWLVLVGLFSKHFSEAELFVEAEIIVC